MQSLISVSFHRHFHCSCSRERQYRLWRFQTMARLSCCLDWYL